jgi:pyridoxamine 5'-phosphate oxidase
MSKTKIADLRTEYRRAKLDFEDVATDPMQQFSQWLEEAIRAQVAEPTAMTLATVGADRRPAARIVLLKSTDSEGFVFYTNYDSRKGRELSKHPDASLLFFWPDLERQVRIEGVVQKVSKAESDAYYCSRPLGSRIGAWASPQSEIIPDREMIEMRAATLAARYGADPPRPSHWGGYRLLPQALEFWQGRPSRLHDRIRYHRSDEGWSIDRLAP